MKRRNGECGKLRRQLKRNKITEGIYGRMKYFSTLLYLKFLFLWALVLLADFVLEFRFEFLWPFWLLIRSVYDSFKYQGLAFSVFFICIALTSDMICFFFIPVHWLFFAASTYVWVQYVWHTGIQEKGICLPTIILWLLFVYIEAAVRLRDLRHLPFHLDLCRPFAAHCIGYPVVTLGFGFKSYVGYRMRKRKQKDVSKENEFYLQLLLQALPLEQQHHNQTYKSKSTLQFKSSPEKSQNTISRSSSDINISNGIVQNGAILPQNTSSSKNNHRKALDKGDREKSDKGEKSDKCDRDKIETTEIKITQLSQNVDKNCKFTTINGNIQFSSELDPENCGVCEEGEIERDKNFKYMTIIKNASTGKLGHQNKDKENVPNTPKERKSKNKDTLFQSDGSKDQKDDYYQKLESEIKKLKNDIQSNKQIENDLKTQLNASLNSEKNLKYDLTISQQENDLLQNKIQNLNTLRHTDKQSISQLERRIQEERHLRSVAESQLAAERKANKAEAAAFANNIKSECTENCRSRRRDFENELKHLRRELKNKDERYFTLEREKQSLMKYKDNHNETEILMQTLSAMQDKNSHLENSLSAETRIKLDLFSALGEAKRQLEIRENIIRAHEKEIYELKSKMAQVLAVMPTDSFSAAPSTNSGTVFAPNFF